MHLFPGYGQESKGYCPYECSQDCINFCGRQFNDNVRKIIGPGPVVNLFVLSRFQKKIDFDWTPTQRASGRRGCSIDVLCDAGSAVDVSARSDHLKIKQMFHRRYRKFSLTENDRENTLYSGDLKSGVIQILIDGIKAGLQVAFPNPT